MFHNIKFFEEGKFYIMTGQGKEWSDYDGPFDTANEACAHLCQLAGPWASPEAIQSAVMVRFVEGMTHLVKDDNGQPINGAQIFWGNAIWYGGEIIFEKDE